MEAFVNEMKCYIWDLLHNSACVVVVTDKPRSLLRDHNPIFGISVHFGIAHKEQFNTHIYEISNPLSLWVMRQQVVALPADTKGSSHSHLFKTLKFLPA